MEKRKTEEKKTSFPKAKLIETLEALCYAHYIDTFIEFLKDKNQFISQIVCPSDMNRVIREFEEYMCGRGFITDSDYIKSVYEFLCEGGDENRISKHLIDFYYHSL